MEWPAAIAAREDDVVGVVVDAVDAYALGRDDDGPGLGPGSGGVSGQAIVFVETKANAERLCGMLAIAYEVRASPHLKFWQRRGNPAVERGSRIGDTGRRHSYEVESFLHGPRFEVGGDGVHGSRVSQTHLGVRWPPKLVIL